jgi:deoxyribodipyrimidine photolyase-like uncharacterized protein
LADKTLNSSLFISVLTAEESCAPVNVRYERLQSVERFVREVKCWLEALRVVLGLHECVIIDTEGDRAEIK